MREIKKNLIRSILIVAASAVGLSLALGNTADSTLVSGQSTGKRLLVTQNSIGFGAYDPYGDFSSASKASIEHVFLPWEDVDLSDLQAADAYAQARGRKLMITVEPWSWSSDSRIGPASLRDGILAGRYDPNIAAICSAASSLQSPISIRWGQEMEDPGTNFPWSHWTPKEFIAAYRHFVTECRKYLPDAAYVWSPKGNKPLTEFYPGDDYVDEIGLSVFGYQPYDKLNFGHERTFPEALEQGYRLVEGFGKPVIVAELGYEGDRNYVTRWAKEVTTPHQQFPRLTAVIYFNTRETYPWPLDMGRPDWRIGSPATVGP